MSTAKCTATGIHNPVPGFLETSPASNGYEPGFSVSLLVKDLKIAIDCADRLGLDLQVLQKSLAYFERVLESGDGNKDHAVVYQHLRRLK